MGWLASFTGAMRPGRVRIMKHLGMSAEARTHTGIGLPPEHIGCGVYFEQILVLLVSPIPPSTMLVGMAFCYYYFFLYILYIVFGLEALEEPRAPIHCRIRIWIDIDAMSLEPVKMAKCLLTLEPRPASCHQCV